MAESGNKYVLKEFKPKDYKLFSSWWEDPPPVTSLPKAGLVCGDMKAVGFLANTDTDFAIITWWHANPENATKESYKAMRKIIMGLIEIARIYNKNYVFCYTPVNGMIKLLEKEGFTGDHGHMMLELV